MVHIELKKMPAKWEKYMKIKQERDAKAELRWPIFNDIVPIEEIYGVYLVAPGKTQTTRSPSVSAPSRLQMPSPAAGAKATWVTSASRASTQRTYFPRDDCGVSVSFSTLE